MKFDWNEIRDQLAPGWSPVNIALALILSLLSWPLGLLMVGYMWGGKSIGLDIRDPGTYSSAVGNLFEAGKAAIANLKGGSASKSEDHYSRSQSSDESHAGSVGKPVLSPDRFDEWRRTETKKLREERDQLEQAKRNFENEKREFNEAVRKSKLNEDA